MGKLEGVDEANVGTGSELGIISLDLFVVTGVFSPAQRLPLNASSPSLASGGRIVGVTSQVPAPKRRPVKSPHWRPSPL